MAVIVDTAELSDVLDVMSQRGIELVYSVENDEVYLYGSESELAEIESILWSIQLIDGLGLVFGRGSSMPEPCEKEPDIHVSHARKTGFLADIWHESD